jgi:type III pantothenate kinase
MAGMLLAIDVGNTQTHIGAFDGDQLIEHWRFATDGEDTADQLAVRLASMLGLRGTELAEVEASIVCSVVPRLNPEYSRMSRRYLGEACTMVGPGVKTGMAVRLDNPHELGADRLVNAVAAYEKLGGPCAVVDFGTAITFDAVSESGEYLGGVIGPGVQISIEALTERAARLPKVDLAEPSGVIGRTTQASLQAGMIYGFAGAIDAIARRLEAEMGEEVTFLATGGMAEAIVPFCETVSEIDDLLTLTGLRLIHELNE